VKQSRQKHSATFKAKVALAALKGQCHQVSRRPSFNCVRLNEVAAVVYISYEHGL